MPISKGDKVRFTAAYCNGPKPKEWGYYVDIPGVRESLRTSVWFVRDITAGVAWIYQPPASQWSNGVQRYVLIGDLEIWNLLKMPDWNRINPM
jgi:hypothetical protein